MSNCLTFFGLSLSIINSSFINNTSIWSQEIIDLFLSERMGVNDIAQLNPELGAAVYFGGVNLFINKSYFSGNTGFKGGALYLTSYILDIKQNVLISECIFNKNRGNVGGAINFSINLKIIDIAIIWCIFKNNIGKSFNS